MVLTDIDISDTESAVLVSTASSVPAVRDTQPRRRGRGATIPMSPLQFEATSSIRRPGEASGKSAPVDGLDKPRNVVSLSGNNTSNSNNMPRRHTKFDVEKYAGSMSHDVLPLLVKAWLDGIQVLDRAADILDPNSHYHYVSHICLQLPRLFVLLAKHTQPSLKAWSKQFGIEGELKSAIYRLWTHRVHPSLKISRDDARFLGSLFS